MWLPRIKVDLFDPGLPTGSPSFPTGKVLYQSVIKHRVFKPPSQKSTGRLSWSGVLLELHANGEGLSRLYPSPRPGCRRLYCECRFRECTPRRRSEEHTSELQ